MNLRTLLRRFSRFERRWIPLPPERDAHEATVRSRLKDNRGEPVMDEDPAEDAERGAATDPPPA